MKSNASLAPFAYVLVGSLAGFGLANLVSPPAAAPVPVGLSSSDAGGGQSPQLEAILTELRKLSGELEFAGSRSLRSGGPAVTPSDASSRRTPAGEGEPTASEMTELLARCTTLLERVERSTTRSRLQELELEPAGTSRDALVQFDRSGDATAAFRRDHILWTYQQVLDKYGKPDQVYSGEQGVGWYYEVNHTSGGLVGITFQFMDGLLVGVYD